MPTGIWEEYGWNDYLADHVDMFVARAKFQGSFSKEPERLAALTNAEEISGALSLDHWAFDAEHYPEPALVADELTRSDNGDVPVRAYCLLKALDSLLRIAGAPEAMIKDLNRFLSEFAPKGAEKYAAAQRALIEHPDKPIEEIARISGLNRSTLHVLLKDGVLVKPH